MKIACAILFLIVSLVFSTRKALACDPCSLFSAARITEPSAGSWTASLYEQFTSYDAATNTSEGTIKNGDRVRNFSITQFGLAYDISNRISVGASLPLVSRKFEEITDYRADPSFESRVGDATLFTSWAPYSYSRNDDVFTFSVIGGIKLPTGDTGTIDVVADDDEPGHEHHKLLTKHTITGTTSGRVLTYGTGSVDYLIGATAVYRSGRNFILADTQYNVRTEGDHDYRFGNDFVWSVIPGSYVYLEHNLSIALGLSLSSETKPSDRRSGALVANSSVDNLYLGPSALFSFAEKWGGEMTVEFRVSDENGSTTIVPTSRIRAGLTRRF